VTVRGRGARAPSRPTPTRNHHHDPEDGYRRWHPCRSDRSGRHRHRHAAAAHLSGSRQAKDAETDHANRSRRQGCRPRQEGCRDRRPQGQGLDDADLDKRVAARADLITKAKAIAKDVKTDGLSDAAIRKAAVTAALGDAAVKDKADAYIDARFDILVEDARRPAAPIRSARSSSVRPADQ
jgi:hypothetical protein